MRISILAGGFGGSVGDMQTDLSRLHSNIEATISDLRSLNRKLDNVNGGTYNLGSAISGINRRIRTEETKLTNLEVTSGKINTFLDNAIETDASVARKVRQNQKEFFKDFPWLRPDNTNTEPSIWEQLAAAWSDFWGDVGDWISDLVSGIVDYLKEHAVELIIGLVAIVIGALLTWLTGGTFLAALAALLKATLIQAAIGAVISGVISWFTGGDFWDAFGDGFAQGFMWGGVFSAISSAITAIRSVIQGLNYADDVANVANVADDVANVADDAANVTDDVANVADDAANVTDDVANVADDAASMSDDVAGSLDDILNEADEVVEGSVDIPDHLPEHRKAELRALNEKGGYDQLSFQNGKRVPHGTTGSTRPDVVRVVGDHLEAVEVKYYDLSKPANRSIMYKELLREVTERAIHLPKGSTQRIVLDVTNRGFDADLVYKVVDQVIELLDDIYPNSPIDVVGLL